jgi:hypothetical protein
MCDLLERHLCEVKGYVSCTHACSLNVLASGSTAQLIRSLATSWNCVSTSLQIGSTTETTASVTPLPAEQKIEWTPQPPPGNEPRIVCGSAHISVTLWCRNDANRAIAFSKGKGKIHSITGHEGPEVK